MKARLSLLFTLFLFITSFAQDFPVRTFPTDEKGLLWKISSNIISHDVYLFGTMHLIERDNFLFPKKLKSKVKKSDVLVMELGDLPDETTVLKYLMLEEGTVLDNFNEPQKDSILDWAQKNLNLSEEAFMGAFGKMKPFALVQIAVQLRYIGKIESYEVSLTEVAEENEIEIVGLETIDEQMAIFDGLSDEQEVEMVMETIRDSAKNDTMIAHMQDIYLRQNVDELYQFIMKEGGIIQQEQNRFLDDRNKNWMSTIMEFADNKSAFIAVGAGHLGGPNGLIRLLEKEGYTLTPIEL